MKVQGNKTSFFLSIIFAFVSPALLTATPGHGLESNTPSFPDEHTPVDLRAWHVNGQTFLVWEESPLGPPDIPIYQVYQSPKPIDSIDDASLVGQAYSDDGVNKRLQVYLYGARWILPNGSGGSHRVAENESYFVFTPHEAATAYYAVVPYNGRIVGTQNTVGPIAEATDPITCYVQHEEEGLTIYAHWIDGREDFMSGRSDYPVMGNEYSNGVGFNFAVWSSQAPPKNAPMACWLHGIAGSFIDSMFVAQGPTMMPDGVFVTLDDWMDGAAPVYTGWIGYADDFNRFFPQDYPADSATVVDYTARRVWWETYWLVSALSIDPDRVSLVGESMGGNGALLHAELRPDLYSAVIANVPRLNINPGPMWFPIFGTPFQRLCTNFGGRPALWDIINAQWRAEQPHSDWPYALIISGKNDTAVPWQASHDAFLLYDTGRTGYALYWDERTHQDWEVGYFFSSEHLVPSYLARFSRRHSFPAFSNTDESPAPGRQPDIGDGDPMSGDPWGTWGGYLEWDPESVVEDPSHWECTIWITSESSCECDIPPGSTVLADVTLRRLQRFGPRPDRVYHYELRNSLTGGLITSGIVRPDEQRVLTIEGLPFSKTPHHLTVTDAGMGRPDFPVASKTGKSDTSRAARLPGARGG